jgi:hypothetical protein
LELAARLLLRFLAASSPLLRSSSRLLESARSVGEFRLLFDAGRLYDGVLGFDVLAAFDGLLDGFFERAHLLFHARVPGRVLLRSTFERRNFRALRCLSLLGISARRLEIV